jgi:hypothetical protein
VLVLGRLAEVYELFAPGLIPALPVPAKTGELGREAGLLGASELLYEGGGPA